MNCGTLIAPQEMYRLALVLPHSRRLLVITDDGTPCLPKIGIPVQSRVGEQLTRAIEGTWKMRSAVVDYLADKSIPIPLAVLELLAEDEYPSGNNFHSIGVHALPETDLTRDERIILERILSGDEVGPGPFCRLGWINDVMAWIESNLSSRGWKLTGQFRQLNADSFFSLIRFETTGPALWFKAVGEPNLCEFPISIALARLFPGSVPTLVATQSSWNAWLAIESEGIHPDHSSELEVWTRGVTSLAAMQVASAGKTEELLGAGCKNLRLNALLDLIDPFVELVEVLMKQQSKVPPVKLGTQELRDLSTELKAACIGLGELDLPDTLGHVDFNPGNILVSADSCVFLDWAEACVSHPFLTFEYLLEHFRRSHPDHLFLQSQLISAYCEPWTSCSSPEKILKALKFTPLVAVFAYAVANRTWCDSIRPQQPKIAGFLRSLARRMCREAVLLEQWREPCLS